MKKPMPTALLFFCMHLSLFARPVPPSSAPIPGFRPPYPYLVLLFVPDVAPFPSDTLPPIHTAWVPPALQTNPSTGIRPAPGTATIRIYNDAPTGNLSNTILQWELLLNGTVRQKGTIGQLLIAPKHSALFHLPAKIPPGTEEAFLHLQYVTRKTPPQITTSHLIAEEQLLLRTWGGNDLPIRPTGELSFTDEDGLFSISSPSILLRFNKQTGWLQHYEIKGFRLIEDSMGPKPNFWRDPPPGNDSAIHTNDTSPAPWQQATLSPRLQLFSTSTGSSIVIVRTEYTLPATSCQLHLAYTINAGGEMLVEQSIETDSTQKGWPLPRFGMQWTPTPGLDSITWYGATDNNPLIGIYHRVISGQPATTIPDRGQPPPANTGVRWWKLTGKDGKGLQITADSSLLTMSAGYYTDRTPATPPQVQLNIDYPPFSLPYRNYHYSYKVTPL